MAVSSPAGVMRSPIHAGACSIGRPPSSKAPGIPTPSHERMFGSAAQHDSSRLPAGETAWPSRPPSVALAKWFNAWLGEGLFWCLGPVERLAAFVPGIDEDPDRLDKVGDAGGSIPAPVSGIVERSGVLGRSSYPRLLSPMMFSVGWWGAGRAGALWRGSAGGPSGIGEAWGQRAGVCLVAAGAADDKGLQVGAAGVLEDDRRMVGEVSVAPVHEHQQHRPQLAPGRGWPVVEARGPLAVGGLLEHAGLDQVA